MAPAMTRRRWTWAGVLALLVAAIFGLRAALGTLTVTLTEADVQSRLDAQLDKELPVKGKAGLLVKSMRVRSAAVHIEDGLVKVLVDVDGTIRTGKNFALTAYAVGAPAYKSGEFYFSPQHIEVQKFSYEGSTPTELASRLARRLGVRDAVRQRIEDKAARVEEWMTSTAENAAMHVLDRRPVYRPKDDVKGLLVRAALASVAVEQDHIVLTFTLWSVTLAVVLGLLALAGALALVVVLIRNPPAGATPSEPAAKT
jgi:hypothetical protein